MAEDLQGGRNRLANRLREQLWRYYPQALELADNSAVEWFLDFWEMASTPGTPLAVSPGTIAAATAHIGAVAARLRLVDRSSATPTPSSDALCGRLAEAEPEPGQPLGRRDATILRSLPSTGRIVPAMSLAEATEPLQRRDHHALLGFAGVAPVTRRSGMRRVALMRQACQPRLRTAVHHRARVAAQRDGRSRVRFAESRQRGHTHGRAPRSVADRLLAVACAMLKAGTAFGAHRNH